MTVQFDLPTTIEKMLRNEFADLNSMAKESTLIELFRQGKISRHELSDALKLGRIEIDELLKSHHVTEDLGTIQDYNATLARLRGKVGA